MSGGRKVARKKGITLGDTSIPEETQASPELITESDDYEMPTSGEVTLGESTTITGGTTGSTPTTTTAAFMPATTSPVWSSTGTTASVSSSSAWPSMSSGNSSSSSSSSGLPSASYGGTTSSWSSSRTPVSNTAPTEIALSEITQLYLLDRNGWLDFKRALNECGLTWNFPAWMTTIVYRGKDWSEYKEKGVNLDEYFSPERYSGVGGMGTSTSDLSQRLVDMLGLPKNVSEFRDTSLRFCNLTTIEFESDRKLPARQKFWTWMVRALRGPKQTPGQYFYLVDEIQRYDIAHLFKRLCQVLEQVTICSLDDELESVIKLDFKPQSDTIFSYYADLRKAVKRLHDVNDRLPKDARIILPDAYLRSRMVRAARQVPIFKPIIDSLLMKKPEEWGVITVEELYHQFEQISANDQSAGAKLLRTPTEDSVSVNTITVHTQKKKEVCRSFSRFGVCKKEGCAFLHANEKKQEEKQDKPERQAERKRPPLTCYRCGESHNTKECKFTGKCNWCKRSGHKESVCNQKKAGKPQVMAAAADADDGQPIRANIVLVEDGMPFPVRCITLWCLMERLRKPSLLIRAPIVQSILIHDLLPLSIEPISILLLRKVENVCDLRGWEKCCCIPQMAPRCRDSIV
jgi:hypothetical protein